MSKESKKNQAEDTPIEEASLSESLSLLKNSVDKSNSLRWTFLLGVVRGVGAVVGASIVAGLLLGWAATTFDRADGIPVIGPLFNSASEIIPDSLEE